MTRYPIAISRLKGVRRGTTLTTGQLADLIARHVLHAAGTPWADTRRASGQAVLDVLFATNTWFCHVTEPPGRTRLTEMPGRRRRFRPRP